MTDDNFRTIGKRQPRYDGMDKITGVARYAADVENSSERAFIA